MRPRKRDLVGRTIVAVDWRSQRDTGARAGDRYDNPLITLDNGADLTFMTQETEASEYGVEVIYHAPDSQLPVPKRLSALERRIAAHALHAALAGEWDSGDFCWTEKEAKAAQSALAKLEAD